MGSKPQSEATDSQYVVQFGEWNAEPLSLDIGEVPDGRDVAKFVEDNYDIWELSVRPGRWSGDEYEFIAVAGTDKKDAEERALNVHRNYSSVIDHSQANLGRAKVEEVSLKTAATN